MPRTTSLESRRRARVVSLNARLRACRRCHLAGYLDERDSVPIARDPEPDVPLPRILLVGQAPGLRATIQDRPFAGIAGDKLRAWFERGGIPRSEFYARIHFAAVTRCYPGRLGGARGDRVPSPEEQSLCRPWLDELIEILEPDIVLLVGLLAIRTFLGPVKSLSGAVGTATIRDGIRYLPLPHPSGVSRWLNEPENVAAVDRAMAILRGGIEERQRDRSGDGSKPIRSVHGEPR
jgi:uracil-DNA glycosylase